MSTHQEHITFYGSTRKLTCTQQVPTMQMPLLVDLPTAHSHTQTTLSHTKPETIHYVHIQLVIRHEGDVVSYRAQDLGCDRHVRPIPWFLRHATILIECHLHGSPLLRLRRFRCSHCEHPQQLIRSMFIPES
eukprot:5815268-Amphidinium_carterae.1